MSKTPKKVKRSRAKILVLLSIIILLILLFLNFRGNAIKLAKDEKVLIVGKQNLFAVYEDKLAVKIPFSLNINSEETVQKLVDTKNYETVLEKINTIMPEKLDKCIALNNDNLKLDVEEEKNIPETNIENKRMILTSSVYSMFDKLYKKNENFLEQNEDILVDVLNANGIGGYARKTGELLKKELGVKYNAANYEKELDESYVILNDISNRKALEIIEKLPEKYFKVKRKSTIPTLANLVVVVGKEKNIDFEIKIFGDKEKYQVEYKKLKKVGYSKIIRENEEPNVEESIIKYNKEDYFTAQKVAKLLGIKNIVETNSLENTLNIIIK